jgi:hypothetical protein
LLLNTRFFYYVAVVEQVDDSGPDRMYEGMVVAARASQGLACGDRCLLSETD